MIHELIEQTKAVKAEAEDRLMLGLPRDTLKQVCKMIVECNKILRELREEK